MNAPVVTEAPERSAADPELCAPGVKIDSIFTQGGVSYLFKGAFDISFITLHHYKFYQNNFENYR
jgi:hypothetical protein